jgi:hypothetical protein
LGILAIGKIAVILAKLILFQAHNGEKGSDTACDRTASRQMMCMNRAIPIKKMPTP